MHFCVAGKSSRVATSVALKTSYCCLKGNREVNPLRDQRQISLCNINTFSVREVVRIKDMISQHEFR